MGIRLKIRIFVRAPGPPNNRGLTNLIAICHHMNTFPFQAIQSQLVCHLSRKYYTTFDQDAIWLKARDHSVSNFDKT